MLIPLKTLIKNLPENEECIRQFLSSFSCTKDKDIEFFLHNRSVDFENLSKARTYLVCDEYELKIFPLDKITIYGYLSIALKILTLPNNLSNRTRKNLDGFSSKIYGEPIRHIPCYLIGQLSRNSNVPKDSLYGSDLICYACNIIAQSVEAVGGRYMMIECRNEEKLIHFYEKNFFKEISRIPDKNIPMVQMIRKIY